MKSLIIDLLVHLANALGSKFIDRLVDWLDRNKPVFTRVRAVIQYSHYVGQNHVREGGEMKIYQAHASLTVFNPGKKPRILRELTLYCGVDDLEYAFQLYDTQLGHWEENYQLAPNGVCSLSWLAVPAGHGLTAQWGAEGVIPFTLLGSIQCHFTYRDEHGRTRQIHPDSATTYRLPKEQIAG